MKNIEKMQEKINIIAKSFGATTGKISTCLCCGKWRGRSDISIDFDNGISFFIGNEATPKAKTQKVQNTYLDMMLEKYNPEVIEKRKADAYKILKKREVLDNNIAKSLGLKEYKLLSVEFNKKLHDSCIGWYYIILSIDGKIHAHITTDLDYQIANGTLCEDIRNYYFIAGGLTEKDVDYVFDNIGHSTKAGSYTLNIGN